MAVRPKLMMGVGIAIAGLGLIGAGAGATFTSQVSASSQINSGGVGLSLNGQSGSNLQLGLVGKDLGSHFTPISQDLVLKNTGLMAISTDIAFLLGFTILAMGAATLLFRRTL